MTQSKSLCCCSFRVTISFLRVCHHQSWFWFIMSFIKLDSLCLYTLWASYLVHSHIIQMTIEFSKVIVSHRNSNLLKFKVEPSHSKFSLKLWCLIYFPASALWLSLNISMCPISNNIVASFYLSESNKLVTEQLEREKAKREMASSIGTLSLGMGHERL